METVTNTAGDEPRRKGRLVRPIPGGRDKTHTHSHSPPCDDSVNGSDFSEEGSSAGIRSPPIHGKQARAYQLLVELQEDAVTEISMELETSEDEKATLTTELEAIRQQLRATQRALAAEQEQSKELKRKLLVCKQELDGLV